MFLWQSVGAFGNKEDNHTINFSLLHNLQEKLTDIYCMRSSLNASQRKRGDHEEELERPFASLQFKCEGG